MTQPTVLTVDVERDWAGPSSRGVDEVLPRLVEMLDRHHVPATFFVVGELAEAVAPHLEGTGHEVGSHSMTHRSLPDLSREEQEWEIEMSRRQLTDLGFTVEGFRAPYLATTAHTRSQVRNAGYRYDASGGRLHPLARGRSRPSRRSLALGTLRGGLPFTLTWLRITGRWASGLVPAGGVMLCHLHELLDGGGGWAALPKPLRHMHARNTGEWAWATLEGIVAQPGRHFVPAGSLA